MKVTVNVALATYRKSKNVAKNIEKDGVSDNFLDKSVNVNKNYYLNVSTKIIV